MSQNWVCAPQLIDIIWMSTSFPVGTVTCKQEVLGRMLAYFPTIRHAPHRKRRLQQFFLCRGNVFTELLPSNDRGIHRQTHRHSRPTILLLFRVFVAAGTCLPSRCLAAIEGMDTQTHRLMRGIYEVSV
jgi:hypothetical protein